MAGLVGTVTLVYSENKVKKVEILRKKCRLISIKSFFITVRCRRREVPFIT